MRKNLFNLLKVAVLLGVAQGVEANTLTIEQGVVNGATATFLTTDMNDSFKPKTNFDDLWTFTLGKATEFSTSITYSKNKFTLFDGWLKNSGGDVIDTFSKVTLGPVGVLETSIPVSLVAGSYTIELKGYAKAAGGYTSNSTFVTAVPEAEEWAMMIVGLGLVGARLGTRKNANSSMAISA